MKVGEYIRTKYGITQLKEYDTIDGSKLLCMPVKDGDNYWRVKREVTLINNREDGIPIIKEEAQGIMKLLDRSAILEVLGSDKE